MATRKPPPSKDRRDIGQVVFPIETMLAARGLSSCCVGVEAALERRSGIDGLLQRLAARAAPQSSESE